MQETEFVFNNGAVALAGTLTQPATTNPLATVIFIHGSGPFDRDANLRSGKLDIFNTLAKSLVQNGIASFRYDKRGCGKSTGNYISAGHFDLVSDAEAAFEFINNLDDIAAGPIFLAGHSEGTIIAAQIATKVDNVAGIILFAPFLQNLEDVLSAQIRHMKGEIKTARGIRGFATRLVVGLFGGVEKIKTKILQKIKNSSQDTIRVYMMKLNARWFREMFSVEPREIYERIQVPTLIIAGEKDVQCAPRDALEISNILGEYSTHHLIKDLTHILRREDGPARISNYRKLLKKPVDPVIATLMIDWINQLQGSPENHISKAGTP